MNGKLKNILLSLAVGFVFYFVVRIFWAYFPSFNPLFQWLLSCCAAEPWIRSAILFQDVLVNILLCIPVALLLLRLKPRSIWLYVFCAVIPGFVIGNHHLFSPEYFSWDSLKLTVGWAMEFFTLPTATMLLILWRKNQVS